MAEHDGRLRPTPKPPARGIAESMKPVPVVGQDRSRSRSPDPGGPRRGFLAGSADASSAEAGALRLRSAGVSPAQFFLVVDSVLPSGWDRDLRLALLDRRRTAAALEQACNAAVTMGAALDRWEHESQGQHNPPADRVEEPSVGHSRDVGRAIQRARNEHESVHQRLADASGHSMAADSDDLCLVCQQRAAVWELGGMECWECYSEH